jgi:hydroxylamine dehydrogenase
VRARIETDQPNADFVKATGQCAEWHSRQQYSIVHEYEISKHASQGVSCLDCHQPQEGQEPDRQDHNGFVITTHITPPIPSADRSCDAAPSWAAVYGEAGLTAEQIYFAEKQHPAVWCS